MYTSRNLPPRKGSWSDTKWRRIIVRYIYTSRLDSFLYVYHAAFRFILFYMYSTFVSCGLVSVCAWRSCRFSDLRNTPALYIYYICYYDLSDDVSARKIPLFPLYLRVREYIRSSDTENLPPTIVTHLSPTRILKVVVHTWLIGRHLHVSDSSAHRRVLRNREWVLWLDEHGVWFGRVCGQHGDSDLSYLGGFVTTAIPGGYH